MPSTGNPSVTTGPSAGGQAGGSVLPSPAAGSTGVANRLNPPPSPAPPRPRRLTQLFKWSRTVHRVFLFPVTALYILMTITGLALKYSAVSRWLKIDEGLARYIHNQLSPYFAIVLGVMVITGWFLYLYPFLARRLHRS